MMESVDSVGKVANFVIERSGKVSELSEFDLLNKATGVSGEHHKLEIEVEVKAYLHLL